MSDTFTLPSVQEPLAPTRVAARTKVLVAWIDWYSYHHARFRALTEHPHLAGKIIGLEMVGGAGVHAGLKFRENGLASSAVRTLLPNANWRETNAWQLARLAWQEASRLQPAVVLVPGYYNPPALSLALWGKLHGKKTVLMTESAEQDHTRSTWKESLKGLLIRSLFDWAVAGGQAHKRYLDKLGFRRDRVAGFYDVVDNSFFQERVRNVRLRCQPSDFGLPSPYFLYVGRFAEEKNLSGLLTAYIAFRRSGGSGPLVLVGGGPLEGELRRQAELSGFADNIHFPGLKSAAELPPYYAFARCFVLPSTREPWGLVVNEALASSLPVIVSSRCGCAEDLVESGANGWTFDPAQPDELTACLHRMDRSGEEELRCMARRSSEIVARFSPAAWASEVARVVFA